MLLDEKPTIRKIDEKCQRFPCKSCREQISGPHQPGSCSLSLCMPTVPPAAQGPLTSKIRSTRFPSPARGISDVQPPLLPYLGYQRLSCYSHSFCLCGCSKPHLQAQIQGVGFVCWSVVCSQQSREGGMEVLTNSICRPSSELDSSSFFDLQISSPSLTFPYQTLCCNLRAIILFYSFHQRSSKNCEHSEKIWWKRD